ncbi:MAG: hypothetical protein NTY30_01785 [Candidatus Berkelbacteria bacterium]|nr:hypothetical protein [Candidatus Berkelbacteria bacterium]
MTPKQAEQMIPGLAACCRGLARRYYAAGLPTTPIATTPAAVRRAMEDAGIISRPMSWWRRIIAWVARWVARFFIQKFCR